LRKDMAGLTEENEGLRKDMAGLESLRTEAVELRTRVQNLRLTLARASMNPDSVVEYAKKEVNAGPWWHWLYMNFKTQVQEEVEHDPMLILAMDEVEQAALIPVLSDDAQKTLGKQVFQIAKTDPKWWAWLNRHYPASLHSVLKKEPEWLFGMNETEFGELVQHVPTPRLIGYADNERVWGVLVNRSDFQQTVSDSCKKRKRS